MRVLEQKHSDKTSILTFFKVYSPYIKSGRRREQDGQALNGPHNKSNIKIGEAGSAISTYSGTIIILPMKGCVRVFPHIFRIRDKWNIIGKNMYVLTLRFWMCFSRSSLQWNNCWGWLRSEVIRSRLISKVFTSSMILLWSSDNWSLLTIISRLSCHCFNKPITI